LTCGHPFSYFGYPQSFDDGEARHECGVVLPSHGEISERACMSLFRRSSGIRNSGDSRAQARNLVLDPIRRAYPKRWAKFVASGCEKFLRAYHNEDHWRLQYNGEAEIIRRFFANTTTAVVALDVGSHHGEWTEQFLAFGPNSSVVCFEILPAIRQRLKERFATDTRVSIADCGLSDRVDIVKVTWNKSCAPTSSICPLLESRHYEAADLSVVSCAVQTGDEYLCENPVGQIDFLKIDTEGHEVPVLKGFAQLLTSVYAPRVIQFEYGITWLAGRHRLVDVYSILQGNNYSIGRLYPGGVDFKRYELSDESFRMGNYIAVRDPGLLKAFRLGMAKGAPGVCG
jgi:FkbM family methyltransferase